MSPTLLLLRQLQRLLLAAASSMRLLLILLFVVVAVVVVLSREMTLHEIIYFGDPIFLRFRWLYCSCTAIILPS